MNMNECPLELPVAEAQHTMQAPQVYQQLGQITRQLHDTLNELGVMPKLQQSAAGLSDARSRLNYIAKKTGEAADKVLTAVELAKKEQTHLRHVGKLLAADAGVAQLAQAAVIEKSVNTTDQLLTDIMMAQDFHDLTGQVVAKVVALAMDLEDSLVQLLVQAAPAELARKDEGLTGPVVDVATAGDVVANQGEVDDLLASLGF